MIHKKEMESVMSQHFKIEDDYTYENVMDALDNYSDRLASKIYFNLPVSGEFAAFRKIVKKKIGSEIFKEIEKEWMEQAANFR